MSLVDWCVRHHAEGGPLRNLRRVVDLLSAMVRGRWSKPVDLITALHDLGIEAILAGAHADGAVGEIEQQLFEVHEQIAATASCASPGAFAPHPHRGPRPPG